LVFLPKLLIFGTKTRLSPQLLRFRPNPFGYTNWHI
jgi:hypothetical protein